LRLDISLFEFHKQLWLAEEAVLVDVKTVESVCEDFGLLLERKAERESERKAERERVRGRKRKEARGRERERTRECV
jgi:hypothetical protein